MAILVEQVNHPSTTSGVTPQPPLSGLPSDTRFNGQQPPTEEQNLAVITEDLFLGVDHILLTMRNKWTAMRNTPGSLRDLVSNRIDIGLELSQAVQGRHKLTEMLHSSPVIVAKYIRLTILDHWFDYRRWLSFQTSLEKLETLGLEGTTQQIDYHRVNVQLAIRDVLVRASHSAYFTLGQLPEFKPYVRTGRYKGTPLSAKPTHIRYTLDKYPEIKSSSVLNSRISKVLQHFSTLEPTVRYIDISLFDDLRLVIESLRSAAPNEHKLVGAAVHTTMDTLNNVQEMSTRYSSFSERYESTDKPLGTQTWESVDRKRKYEQGRVRDILFSTPIETKIQHLRCLESPSTVAEIWAAIDQTCMAKEGMGFDDMLRVLEYTPSPRVKFPRPVEKSAEATPAASPTEFAPTPPSTPVSPGVFTTQPKEAQAVPQLKIALTTSDGEERKEKQKGRMERKAKDAEENEDEGQSSQLPDTRAILPKFDGPFHLGHRKYETMKKLLVTGGMINYSDFDKARSNHRILVILIVEAKPVKQVLAALGFSKTSNHGSLVTYKGPDWANTKPIRIHRTHTSRMEPWQVLGVRTKFAKRFQWRLEYFSDQRLIGQDLRDHPHLYPIPELPHPLTTAKKTQVLNNSETRRLKFRNRRNMKPSK